MPVNLNNPLFQVTLPIIVAMFVSVSTNNRRLDDLKDRMNDLATRIGRIEDRLIKIEERLTAVEKKVDALEIKAWR